MYELRKKYFTSLLTHLLFYSTWLLFVSTASVQDTSKPQTSAASSTLQSGATNSLQDITQYGGSQPSASSSSYQGYAYPNSVYQHYDQANYGPSSMMQPYDHSYLAPYTHPDDTSQSNFSYGSSLSNVAPYFKGRTNEDIIASISPEILLLIKILIKLIEVYWSPELFKWAVGKILGKVALFLAGAVIFLVLGGLFTTAICALTPLCTITFMGYGLNKENMRSFMTPDNLEMASTFITDAIEKYQKLNNIIEKTR